MQMTIPDAVNLPQELLAVPKWHAWKFIGSKKMPINGRGEAVDHTAVRVPYSEAKAIAKRHGGGIGYSIDNKSDGTDDVFIDLDGCFSESGEPKEWALPIIHRFGGTYKQVSASGTGLHIFCRGRYPSRSTKIEFEGEHHNLQVFNTKRFAAMTGTPEPAPILDKQDALDWLAAHLESLKASQRSQAAKQAEFADPARELFTETRGKTESGRVPGDWERIRARAAGYMKNVPPAISGNMGGTKTLESAMKVMTNFDLTQAEAYEVLADWNQTCEPPWNDGDLRRKISEADKFASDRGRLLKAEFEPQASQWNESEPFPEIELKTLGHCAVMPFPLDQIPQPLGEIALKAAETIRTHPDLVAVSMLAVMGATVGRSVNVRIRPGWVAWPSCWYALVSPVGFGKSPAIAFAERELKRIDAVLVAQSQARLDAWQAECDSLKKGEPKPTKPPMYRIRMRSGTLAALVDCHNQNEMGILYSPDELNSWLAGMGEFSKGGSSDRSNWLSARTGGDISQDRISGGLRYVPASAITILGGLPPAMLGEFLDGPGDGLIERLMFAYPDHHHRPDPPGLEVEDEELFPEWDLIIRRLYNFRVDENDKLISQPIQINLAANKGAAEAFHRIECMMNARINEDLNRPLPGSTVKYATM